MTFPKSPSKVTNSVPFHSLFNASVNIPLASTMVVVFNFCPKILYIETLTTPSI